MVVILNAVTQCFVVPRKKRQEGHFTLICHCHTDNKVIAECKLICATVPLDTVNQMHCKPCKPCRGLTVSIE